LPKLPTTAENPKSDSAAPRIAAVAWLLTVRGPNAFVEYNAGDGFNDSGRRGRRPMVGCVTIEYQS
jgi:hypothetical protein